ncbi:hypothetical protein ATZ36_13675 [Candidatus Endomicrobiellum trichonymphae]|uniref:Cytidyltransferase-like domain-containing protein n=1 Tax=Endomicrobium trichonymphae TaxID=1408204 RepID=A0A1E5IMB5_ENDTX|nr:hypothetical protein ATZ36_13675 [Candidatus Endomicrobium trichonymphae]
MVFTNDCFDLLHLSHINLFEKAKSMGDVLLVTLNSDKSLSCLKCSQRPLSVEKDRAKLLLSLKFIDYVVVSSELRMDILVKDGDYKLP